MTTKRNTKAQRWNFRVAEEEDALVRAASDLESTSFTGFVRNAAVAEAQRVLADRSRFEVDEADWKRFNELLDRPAQVPSGLRDLFSRPSSFD